MSSSVYNRLQSSFLGLSTGEQEAAINAKTEDTVSIPLHQVIAIWPPRRVLRHVQTENEKVTDGQVYSIGFQVTEDGVKWLPTCEDDCRHPTHDDAPPH